MSEQDPQQVLPFDQKFYLIAETAAIKMLEAIPELEGVAVVPSWSVQQPYVPPGLIKGRNGELSNPAELHHMATQLQDCLRQLLDRHVRLLQQLDQMAAEIVKKAK